MSFGSAKVNAVPSTAVVPSAEEIGVELKAAVSRSNENVFKYTYDFGLKRISDPLIDNRKDSKDWSFPQDVELIIACRAEEGQELAYAEIKIDQSSNEREAKIIGGGIGQNYVRLLIKARNTYWFKYEIRMYGRRPLTEVHLEKINE